MSTKILTQFVACMIKTMFIQYLLVHEFFGRIIDEEDAVALNLQNKQSHVVNMRDIYSMIVELSDFDNTHFYRLGAVQPD